MAAQLPGAATPPPNFVASANVLRLCSTFLSTVCFPGGTLLSDWPPTGRCMADHSPPSPAIQQGCNSLHCSSVQPARFSLFDNRSIKSLIEVKIHNTRYSPPIHQPSHLVLEGYQVGQAWLPFYKSVFNILNHILVLNVFGNAIQEDTISFPGMKVKLTDLQFPESLLFSKTGEAFAFLQFSGASLSHYDLSKIIEIGLSMTSASSLSTAGCIQSGLIDLCFFQFIYILILLHQG